jgi:hypothetical protein
MLSAVDGDRGNRFGEAYGDGPTQPAGRARYKRDSTLGHRLQYPIFPV